MPELPEVEKLTKDLQDLWIGRKIKEIVPVSAVLPDKFVEGISWNSFRKTVVNYTVLGVERVAKNLVLTMSSGHLWRIHLGSTGWLLQTRDMGLSQLVDREFIHSVGPNTHRLEVTLSDGQLWVYADARTWGRFHILAKTKGGIQDHKLLQYGPDWLEEPESAAIALLNYKGNRTIKDVLCDQHVAAGIGNYLACEACYVAGIHPHTRKQSIWPQEMDRLIHATKQVIAEAIKSPNKSHWRVFLRAGEKCPEGHAIEYVKDASEMRGSYFCPICQGIIGD